MSSSEDASDSQVGTIMLVGCDRKKILQRRCRAAGACVVRVSDGPAALERARHKLFVGAVLIAKGPLANVVETVLNLRDLQGSMPIIILIDRMGRSTSRSLRRLLEHPIDGTQIVTRRRLSKHLRDILALPPGSAR